MIQSGGHTAQLAMAMILSTIPHFAARRTLFQIASFLLSHKDKCLAFANSAKLTTPSTTTPSNVMLLIKASWSQTVICIRLFQKLVLQSAWLVLKDSCQIWLIQLPRRFPVFKIQPNIRQIASGLRLTLRRSSTRKFISQNVCSACQGSPCTTTSKSFLSSGKKSPQPAHLSLRMMTDA